MRNNNYEIAMRSNLLDGAYFEMCGFTQVTVRPVVKRNTLAAYQHCVFCFELQKRKYVEIVK